VKRGKKEGRGKRRTVLTTRGSSKRENRGEKKKEGRNKNRCFEGEGKGEPKIGRIVVPDHEKGKEGRPKKQRKHEKGAKNAGNSTSADWMKKGRELLQLSRREERRPRATHWEGGGGECERKEKVLSSRQSR